MTVVHPPTLIWRHRKENLKKCSLRGLEGRAGFEFFTYPHEPLPDLNGYLLLAVDAPPLSPEEAGHGLLLLDATWRYAEVMLRHCPKIPQRSLPQSLTTAYPRRQETEHGLASIEALYAAHHLLGYETDGLLDHYYWRDLFVKQNFNCTCSGDG